jgi:hypothetical protein
MKMHTDGGQVLITRRNYGVTVPDRKPAPADYWPNHAAFIGQEEPYWHVQGTASGLGCVLFVCLLADQEQYIYLVRIFVDTVVAEAWLNEQLSWPHKPYPVASKGGFWNFYARDMVLFKFNLYEWEAWRLVH